MPPDQQLRRPPALTIRGDNVDLITVPLPGGAEAIVLSIFNDYAGASIQLDDERLQRLVDLAGTMLQVRLSRKITPAGVGDMPNGHRL